VARLARTQEVGSLFHVTTRGVRGELVYVDRLDRVRFLELLGKAVHRHGWALLGYCLMGNHYHLVLRLREETLSAGMHLLNGAYARRFNERHGHTGHLFDRRFYGEQIERQEHLLEVLRYMALNPVRAGLCDDPATWEWSSFRATARLARPPAFLSVREARGLFGQPSVRAAKRYDAFVRSALPAISAVA
jgi:REP-associated tyrosine transposase